MTALDEILALAQRYRGGPPGGEPLAEFGVVEAPAFGWGFEDANLTFEVKNLGIAELADPARHDRVIATVDVHDGAGRFLRRAAARPVPDPIAVGETRQYRTPVPINVFAGDYQIRCGLQVAERDSAGSPGLRPLAVRGQPRNLRIKNTIFEMFVEVVNACNFRCSFCPQGELVRKQQPMDFDLATKIVKDLADMGHHHPIRCHILGEPLLYKRLFDFVDVAHEHGQKIHLATNGSRFTDEHIEGVFRTGLDHLLISLNTPEESLYNEQRGTNVPYAEYIAGITKMVTARVRRGGPTETIINVLYSLEKKSDPAELSRVRNIVREWVDVAREAGARGLPDAEELVGLKGVTATLVELIPGLNVQFTGYHAWGEGRAPGAHFCSLPWRQLGVFVDGQATACCVDAQGEIHLGDARFQTIEEIWNGAPMERVRAGFRRGEAVEPRCQRCNISHDKAEFIPTPQGDPT